MKREGWLLVLLSMMLSALFLLSACWARNAQESGKNVLPSNPEGESSFAVETVAQAFLRQNDDDSLYTIVAQLHAAMLPKATQTIGTEGFSQPRELTSDGLFNFFLTVASDEAVQEYFDEASEEYVIPLDVVTIVLDQYFEGYVFYPQSVSFTGTYDKERQVFVLQGLAPLGGPAFLKIIQSYADSPDEIVLTANHYDWSEDETSTEVISVETMRLKISDNGYRYLSDTIK